jgi:hypothetical protein
MPMYWYDSTWKQTTDLWVWNGSWTNVQECYIWDGSNWKLCHTAPASLDSFSICDISCDPELGNFRASWTYTSAFASNWKIELAYSFDSGTSWPVYDNNIDITTSPYTGTLEGFFGFTSLDNTYFRLRMIDVATSTVDATNSPRYAYPTFACC